MKYECLFAILIPYMHVFVNLPLLIFYFLVCHHQSHLPLSHLIKKKIIHFLIWTPFGQLVLVRCSCFNGQLFLSTF